MRLFIQWIFGMSLIVTSVTAGAEYNTVIERWGHQIKIGIFLPQGEVKADLIFVHGFGDCYANHRPYFKELNQRGIKVFAFNFPDHYGSSGPLDSFSRLMDLVQSMESLDEGLKSPENTPLLLSGWSTGGLVVVRLLQKLRDEEGGVFKSESKPYGFRKPKGVVLFTPGVALNFPVDLENPRGPINFGDNGWVTEDTLTRNSNPSYECPIWPKSPILPYIPPGDLQIDIVMGQPHLTQPYLPLEFALKLQANSIAAWTDRYPKDIPTLIFVGGDESDLYVNTQGIKNWKVGQRILSELQAKMQLIQCDGAYHDIENEPEPLGSSVRKTSAQFLLNSLSGKTEVDSSYGILNNCQIK